MGYNMAGAEFAGGDTRRQRAMAHKKLYFIAMDEALLSVNIKPPPHSP